MEPEIEPVILEDGTKVFLGCLQPEELRFAAAPAWDEKNPTLPESECRDTNHLEQFLHPVRQQLNNNCTNASLACLLEALKTSTGEENVEPLSMTMQYALHNGGRDRGAYCRDLADSARKIGLCRDKLWGDDKIYLPRSGQLPQEVLEDAKNTVVLEIYQCMNWDEVRTALALDYFVYHGFVLGNAFFKTKSDGVVPNFDGSFANGHAMFSYGLTRKFGSPRAMTRNTWGASFGDKGNCYIPKSYFWDRSGQYVNLDAFAIRALRVHSSEVPEIA